MSEEVKIIMNMEHKVILYDKMVKVMKGMIVMDHERVKGKLEA